MEEPPAQEKRTPEESFAMNMRRLREAKGWSQADLVEKIEGLGLSLHRQTIQKIESQSRPLKLVEARLIAEALDEELDAMLGPPFELHLMHTMLELNEAYVQATSSLYELYKCQERTAWMLDAYDMEIPEATLNELTATHEDIHEKVARTFRYERSRMSAMFEEEPEILEEVELNQSPESVSYYQRLVQDKHADLMERRDGEY